MRSNRLNVTDPMDAVLAEVRRRLAAGREGNFVAELGGGDPGYALYWAQLSASGAPGSPPDERYLVDEVRPAGLDAETGAVVWELVPGGRRDRVAWNVAEAVDRTHELPAGRVVLVREELDQASPPEFRSIFFAAAGVAATAGSRMVRITGFSLGAYTVQPVTWSGAAWADDGPPVSGVVNVGEIRDEEAGYLAGPSGHAIYARLYSEGGQPFLAVHPPRMV